MSGKHFKAHEVSCCIKYFIFGFNIIFWVSPMAAVCASGPFHRSTLTTARFFCLSFLFRGVFLCVCIRPVSIGHKEGASFSSARVHLLRPSYLRAVAFVLMQPLDVNGGSFRFCRRLLSPRRGKINTSPRVTVGLQFPVSNTMWWPAVPLVRKRDEVIPALLSC